MRKKKKRRSSKWLAVCITAVLLAGAVFAGYQIWQHQQSDYTARSVLSTMQKVIPGLGEESAVNTGMGRDPLVALNLEGIDIVGCLQVPSLDLMAPVADKKIKKASFATWVSGSPVKGKFRLTGNREDVFRNLTKAAPGDKVVFTDVDGVRYEYEVTTQLNLKDWDEGEYDLMLCYDVDSKTQFVVGCTSKE